MDEWMGRTSRIPQGSCSARNLGLTNQLQLQRPKDNFLRTFFSAPEGLWLGSDDILATYYLIISVNHFLLFLFIAFSIRLFFSFSFPFLHSCWKLDFQEGWGGKAGQPDLSVMQLGVKRSGLELCKVGKVVHVLYGTARTQ
ncbi:hypothetical protein L873DRAFT_629948 [Choiromyces venosus 120613-1]|uniref:Uncharacterized protein n=1 Tax=Choiromyces venosus 120613-1 TaxID=1336337 RepID=A0A3N4JT74_9PEZI|nr:hypothetical protein L873DRAFT_629948 [Choiromyces venosus 120613-1]